MSTISEKRVPGATTLSLADALTRRCEASVALAPAGVAGGRHPAIAVMAMQQAEHQG